MDIFEMAIDSGMHVILDGRIGNEEYRSVVGSVQALQRFADALLKSVAHETHTTESDI
ncbi:MULTISPECIES: hypothetical protein [Paraburkholderia]|uniref:Uncharacterized protein n=1 Tax=Paraburkholderia madseniana TaxID=2599607 RepID=A0AAP5EZV7_9BURK|nr:MULTISPECIES: hypothetical protein [Paraburkholderia]MCX4149984.1 hypothetical protein [Paraburkholderia madseniana]MDN7152920.1 hypothetical protein [Paraburkholderia sp. WS6]MDQ6411802.1 hypothetical protein [Paraburkholderia madseniana]